MTWDAAGMNRILRSGGRFEAMAAYGIPETDIAQAIGIDPKTLRKCYRQELDLGETKVNAQVAGFLSRRPKAAT